MTQAQTEQFRKDLKEALYAVVRRWQDKSINIERKEVAHAIVKLGLDQLKVAIDHDRRGKRTARQRKET